MDTKRLKQLAGLTEELNYKAAIESFGKISNEMTSVMDEIYDMKAEDRTEALAIADRIGDDVKRLKSIFSKYF